MSSVPIVCSGWNPCNVLTTNVIAAAGMTLLVVGILACLGTIPGMSPAAAYGLIGGGGGILLLVVALFVLIITSQKPFVLVEDINKETPVETPSAQLQEPPRPPEILDAPLIYPEHGRKCIVLSYDAFSKDSTYTDEGEGSFFTSSVKRFEKFSAAVSPLLKKHEGKAFCVDENQLRGSAALGHIIIKDGKGQLHTMHFEFYYNEGSEHFISYLRYLNEAGYERLDISHIPLPNTRHHVRTS